MESPVTFQAVYRHVVRRADGGQVRASLGLFGNPELAPGPVAQIDDTVFVFQAVHQRMGSLERVVVVLQYDINVISLEQRAPAPSLILTRARLPLSPSGGR